MLRRGGPGLGGLQKRQEQLRNFKDAGAKLEQDQMKHLLTTLDVFRSKLEWFAAKHKADINKNPQFRKQFVQMCMKIGVDPLACNKGMWSVLGMGDFYYELGVAVAEICLLTREENGGIIEVTQLKQIISKKRSRMHLKIHSNVATTQEEKKEDNPADAITEADIIESVKRLRCLGQGFRLLEAGSKSFIISVPMEMNTDHSFCMQLAQSTGFFSLQQLSETNGWGMERAKAAADVLLSEGMVWYEENPSTGDKLYYFPSLFDLSYET